MKTYLAVYLGSAFLALVITPLVILLAQKVRVLDIPDARKVHSKTVPRIGGVAIFTSAVSLVLPVLLLQNVIGEAFWNIKLKVIVLLTASSFMFIIGLIDDIKGLRARIKLLAQITAAIVVCAVGIQIKTVAVADWLTIDFGWMSWPLTILWIVGITNAINLSDGLDGLAAGISAVACGVIALLAVHSGDPVMAVLMLVLLGSLTGFLFFNFNPANIFMGDCGSLYLGFMIGAGSVMCAAKSETLVGLALPFLTLGIPIFDTLCSMLRRFLERRSLFSPDRSHFHHRLLALGLTQRHVVIVAYAVTCLFAGMGLFMMVTRSINTLVIFFCILLLLLLLFRIVGSVHLRETIAGLRRKYTIAQHEMQERMVFEQAQLYFRSARTFNEWWQAVCEAANRMDFAWVSLKTTDEDGIVRTEIWRPGNFMPPEKSDVVIMDVPVRNHGIAIAMEFEIAISVNDSLESASHRATLFNRLIDEHDIAQASMERG